MICTVCGTRYCSCDDQCPNCGTKSKGDKNSNTEEEKNLACTL